MDTAKLLANIDTNGPLVIADSRCWLFRGKTDKRGRGQIWLDGRNQNVRRAVYKAAFGDLDDIELRRVCGTKECVRPEHQAKTEFTRGFVNKKEVQTNGN